MSARTIDVNGYFTIPRNPISRVGVFPYTKQSIQFPGWESDPQGMVNVYRPEDELSDPETVKSFQLLPWVDDHKMIGDPADDPNLTPIEKKGAKGTTGEQIEYDPTDRTLYANIKGWSQNLRAAIDAGKKDLSLGFRCVYEFASGVFEGQPFQAIQRTIRGNHNATVQHGRMGPGVAVLDHFEFAFDASELEGIIPMAKKVTHRANVAKKMGIAMDSVDKVLGFDPATNPAYKTVMDAEEDEADGDDATPSGGMTLEDIADMLADVGPAMAKINEALAAMAGAPAADDPSDPTDMGVDDDMEPMMDAMGKPVMDAAGKPMMQKKAAPAVDAVPPALAACDAAIAGLEVRSAKMHAALKGRSAPPVLAAMDAAITTAKTNRAKIKTRKAKRTGGTAMDSRIEALETTIRNLQAVNPVRVAMDGIAKRDALYSKVSAFVGTFACDSMDVADVAKYAADKFGLASKSVEAVEAYLHNRPLPSQAPGMTVAKAFGMDEAPKPTAKVNSFLAGSIAA